jgi:hypothetical protein
MKQLWTIGIHDKRLLAIIAKMLKAEIEGVGIPTKGVPQGGILSPLLSNIVLNELDWWVSSQWETFETNNVYVTGRNKHGKEVKRNIYRALRKTNLKEMYILRYADDFKIMCRQKDEAEKIFIAVKQWLTERLKLEISPEKSKITDVRKTATEFLGFKIKAVMKSGKHIVHSHMTDKAIKNATNKLRQGIKDLQKHPNLKTVYRYNAIVVGLQNYYQTATHVSIDFSQINYSLLYCMKNRINPISGTTGFQTKDFKERYKGDGKIYYVYKTALYPIADIQHRNPMGFNQEICNYTQTGRKLIHDRLGHIDVNTLHYLMNNPVEIRSVEFNDNRLSLYSAQKGICRITGVPLSIGMEVHHINPVSKGGDDRYKNLILITYEAHKLIHATEGDTIAKYLAIMKPDKTTIESLNKYRLKVGNTEITVD